MKVADLNFLFDSSSWNTARKTFALFSALDGTPVNLIQDAFGKWCPVLEESDVVMRCINSRGRVRAKRIVLTACQCKLIVLLGAHA